MLRSRPAQIRIPLLIAVALLLVAVAVVVVWWNRSPRDDRIEIVFWGHPYLSDEIYTLIHNFERRNPRYRVTIGTAVSVDITGDAQRLLSAVAGGVPPDVVWFDRFAIGEWAGRNALTDLTPYLEKQNSDDPYRIDLSQFYPWAVEEASYRPPGSNSPARVFGIPTEADVRMLFANADLLRQEGYVDARGEPVSPKNWDELRAYAKRLTRFKRAGDPRSGIARLGYGPNTGNSWFYLYSWEAGGEFLNSDRTRCTFDSPANIRALRYMAEICDDVGGYGQVNGFQETFGGGAMDPFTQNILAMKVDANSALEWIAYYRPDMDFVVAPPPMPQDQIDAGKGPVSWSGGYSLVIPATAKQKDGAFKLVQYLYSWEACQLMA